jgi:predicted RNA methylase
MKVEQNILEILDRCTVEGAVLRLPSGQLDRRVYMAVNKVIEAAGGKWNRNLRGHAFDHDAAEALEPILLTGEVTNAKQEFGVFFTPPGIARRVIELAGVTGGERVLEPNAGEGALLRALPPAHPATAIEINPAFADRCRRDLPHVDVNCGDFLEADPCKVGRFKRIAMNPPFSRQADIAHVAHALNFLERGGRLVSIMSAGTSFRQDKKSRDLRDLVAERSGQIENLPAGSFKDSGTAVNTMIAVIPAAP